MEHGIKLGDREGSAGDATLRRIRTVLHPILDTYVNITSITINDSFFTRHYRAQWVRVNVLHAFLIVFIYKLFVVKKLECINQRVDGLDIRVAMQADEQNTHN